ncbi:MAG: hypothetical protein IKO49_04125 [Bacilli bacterium]|nr:hypothetical protein [Bacilli bacterium]
MNEFRTEENNKKIFSIKKFIPIIGAILIIILIICIVVFITKRVNKNKKTETKTETKTENIVNLNSELDGAYLIAKEDSYLVVLRKNKEPKRIYNISQGTGNLGDFYDYAYFNKKIYILFGENNIYSISLKDGNGIYELKKEYIYEPLLCKNGTKGKTQNIVVTSNIVYFNNSSCGISGFNYGDENNQVNIHQFSKLTQSSIYYYKNKLYFSGDNNIYEVDETTGNINKIIENIQISLPLIVYDDILLYAVKNSNNTYNYYGYNTATTKTGSIVNNVKKLVVYDGKYIYYDSNGIYTYDGSSTTTIYEKRYNELSNMELMGNILQIVDKSTIGDQKKKIVNIDLKKNYKKTTAVNEYSLVKEIN